MMAWFTRSRTRLRGAAQSNARHVPLALECLEGRILCAANVFVVPFTVPADSTHFYSLSSALPAAGQQGSVTIEPGAHPDAAPVTVTQFLVVIQGDPNVPGDILPSYDINVNTSNVSLVNLHLGTVNIGSAMIGVGAITVKRSLVNTITESTFTLGSNTTTQNQITGSVTLNGNTNGTGNDVVTYNTFTSVGGSTPLHIANNAGALIQSNTFVGRGVGGQIGIELDNSGTTAAPAVIANNTFSLTDNSVGIEIVSNNGVAMVAQVFNNTINASNLGGTGLKLDGANNQANLTVKVQGNDFHGNAIGVDFHGSNSAVVNVDLGGGSLNSLGGNNFRSFTATATTTAAAILLNNTAAGAVLFAQNNIFLATVAPGTTVRSNTAGTTIAVTALNANRAFVQSLYNDTLGRTGSAGELDNWVSLLNSNGQAAVVNGILRSREALGRIIDGYYLQYLGRQSDAGREGWINLLQSGARQEDVQAIFLSTPEFLSHINTDYVQALYLLTLHRTGNAAELASWYSVLPSLGLQGVAAAFTTSQENRYSVVADDFQRLLHRPASAGELSGFAGSSADLLTLEAAVLSSGEFFTNG